MEDNTFSTATTTSLDVTTAYLHHDSLGSVIFITDEDGAVVAGSWTHHLPFGGYDNGPPTADITDLGYTGHRHNDDLGLIYMNARYYDPFVRRFISADAIVPDPTNPQSFNRYAYTRNNPVNFTDPTGHRECGSASDCSDLLPREMSRFPPISFTAVESQMWTITEMALVRRGAMQVTQALYEAGDGRFASPREAFVTIYGGAVTFHKTDVNTGYLGKATAQNKIVVYSGISITDETTGSMWAAHELGHAFNYALHPNTTDNLSYGQGIIDLAVEGVFADINDDRLPDRIAGNTTQSYANDNFYVRTDHGYLPGINPGGFSPYQQNTTNAVSEDFADMFMNWAFNSFANNAAGEARYNFVDNHMSAWINLAISNNQ